MDQCNVEESCGPPPTEEPGNVGGCTDPTHLIYYTCCPGGLMTTGGGASDGATTCTANGSPQPIAGDDCTPVTSSGGTINAWCCAH